MAKNTELSNFFQRLNRIKRWTVLKKSYLKRRVFFLIRKPVDTLFRIFRSRSKSIIFSLFSREYLYFSLAILATIIIIYLAVFFYKNFSSDPQRLAHYGGFISGISSALAFIWIVTGYLLQSNELRETRKILRLQQISLDRTARVAENENFERLYQRAVASIHECLVAINTALDNKGESLVNYNTSNEEIEAEAFTFLTKFLNGNEISDQIQEKLCDGHLPMLEFNMLKFVGIVEEFENTLAELQGVGVILSSLPSIGLMIGTKNKLIESFPDIRKYQSQAS